MVVKAGTLYSLHTSWIFNLVAFAEQMYADQVVGSSLETILPNGTKAAWNFNSISLLHDFWNHLILVALRNSTEKTVFEWLPHPWYQLIHNTRLESFRKALLMASERFYIIVGGHSFLDRICEPYWKSHDMYQYSFSRSEFDSSKYRGIIIVGDFLITLDFVPSFMNRLDSFFKEIKSFDDPEVPSILQFLKQKTSLTLKFERNQKKTSLLRKKFTRHFGLLG